MSSSALHRQDNDSDSLQKCISRADVLVHWPYTRVSTDLPTLHLLLMQITPGDVQRDFFHATVAIAPHSSGPSEFSKFLYRMGNRAVGYVKELEELGVTLRLLQESMAEVIDSELWLQADEETWVHFLDLAMEGIWEGITSSEIPGEMTIRGSGEGDTSIVGGGISPIKTERSDSSNIECFNRGNITACAGCLENDI